MFLKVVLLLCAVYVVSGKHVKITSDDDDDKHPALKWPKKYSVEARKYYMTSGFVENFKYWRSGSSSRLEENDGAVIKITKRLKKVYGMKYYKIHPETTEEEINKMVCVEKQQSFVSPEELLPQYVQSLIEEDDDNVKGVDCVKFTNADDSDSIYKKTLWAYYDNSTEHWVPVRYITKRIDEWHGFFLNYEVWDYFNFKDDVDVDAFKVTLKCTTKKDDDDELAFNKSNNDYLMSLKPKQKEELDNAFSKFKQQFDKKYIHEKEHEMRKRIFYQNWRLVNKRNSENLGYKLALNQLSDRTHKEMNGQRHLKRDQRRKVGSIPFPYSEKTVKKLAETLPTEYDSRLEGLVGQVFNREDCQSSWAFASVAAVEGALARRNGGTWKKLSEQALLDCSWGFGNKGCDGGTDIDSYDWIMEHGLPIEQKYGTYANKEGLCKMENMTKTYKIKGYTHVTPFSIEALKVALINYGPLSVSVNSGSLYMYDSGIFYDPHCSSSPKDLDTVMTLVGYGEKDDDTFWILKHSKGPYWGTDGYIHISARDNNCGVMTAPIYVVV